MELKLYEPRKHFTLVYGWWKAHRNSSLDLDSLSGSGLVAYQDEKPVAAAWLFMSNGKVAQIGWPVVNPDSGMKQKTEAITLLIQGLSQLAKDQGYTRMMTFSSSSGLTRKFQKEGFTKLIPHDLLIKAL